MAENPPTGWYTDPGDSTRQRYWNGTEWTKRTRAAGVAPGTVPTAPSSAASASTVSATDPFNTGNSGAEPSPIRTRTIAAIALGVLVAVGAGVAVMMARDESPQPRPTDTSIASEPSSSQPTGPAPSPTVSGMPSGVPEDWATEVSQVGSFTFQRGPNWWDASGPEDLDDLVDSLSDLPNSRADYGGLWFTYAEETDLDGDLVILLAIAADGGIGSLRLETSAFVREAVKSQGGGEIDISREEELQTAQGIAGYVIDYSYQVDGEDFFASVVSLRDDRSMIFIQGVSWIGLEAISQNVAHVSNSIVPQFPL